VVSVREGEGESTGNGQTYTLHSGQRGTFSGTESLNAEVEEIGGPDEFDNWAYSRDRRYEGSRSAQYLSHDVVGYEDLDDYGEWRDDSNYGHVWFPRGSPHPSASGVTNAHPLSPMRALTVLSTLQSADIVLPTTDGCEIRLRRITEPTSEQKLLLQQLKISLSDRFEFNRKCSVDSAIA
jgi:hypothetical protein